MSRTPGQSENGTRLRHLPSVDKVLGERVLVEAGADLPYEILLDAVRAEIAHARSALLQDGVSAHVPTTAEVAERAAERAWLLAAPSLKPVINATGVVIHTNLGRAPLSRAALEAVQSVAGYSNLEYSLEDGKRGTRYLHAAQALRRVTGCEDALVVNNNAAALVLVLTAFAAGKEVILSRGMAVEIGGGFRIPDVMLQSGARLVEVGTTNRTYARDYDQAITPETALLMRVHASNFRIVGFTSTPTLSELANLAHERGLLMVDDVGSGALLDTTRFGLAPEPMVQASIQGGADLVLFSGDKLLGGPQCGIIAGKAVAVELLKKHPLMRALRVDKMTLSALEATLGHYLRGEAEKEVPVWRMISMSLGELDQKANDWASTLEQAGVAASVEPGESAIGGGSLPGETLPTRLVSIRPRNAEKGEADAGSLAAALRRLKVPVVGRVENGALLLDPRTVLDGQEQTLLSGVLEAYSNAG